MVLAGYYSFYRTMLSGVPQGSILGPFLFTLYIDDLSEILPTDCRALLYADDCKIFKQINNERDVISLQSALNRIHSWCDTWKLKINPSKSSLLSFIMKKKPILSSYTINASPIPLVNFKKDLGIVMDTKLFFCAFKEHH